MKRTALLLTMIMVLVMIFSLSSCSFDATLTQGTFVEGTFVEDLLVKNYNINFVVNGETTTVTCKQGLVPTAPDVKNYETDSKSYAFIGWDKPIVAATEDATYTAVFTAATKFYDVTFVYGEDKSATTQLHWGAEVKGEAPTSGLNYQTVDKVYTFTGWDKELLPVSGDVVYTAQYEESARKYNVYFVYGEDDSEYVELEVAYGTVPTAPTGDFDFMTESTVYTFNGWDKEIAEVTGKTIYYATYTESPREYTITLIYDGKTEVKTMKYGETVQLPTPAGYSTVAYNFIFNGWDKLGEAVTGDATYTASYEITPREYTITFIYEGKTETATYKYGETVVLPKTVVYTDGTNTYAFKAWDKEAATVTGNATYTAEYVVGNILYSQDFNSQDDFDKASGVNDTAATTHVLDSTWTLSLSKGGAYAKTAVDANDPNNKYVVAGVLETHASSAACQFNPKGSGIASMGDFTKVSISIDLAAKEGVQLGAGYIRFRSAANKYLKFFEYFNSGAVKFNGVDIEGVTINTTIQTFTFEFDFVAGTATLLVDGQQKYTGAISTDVSTLGTSTYLDYAKACTGYMFNWAITQVEGETAICLDNLYIVAHE